MKVGTHWMIEKNNKKLDGKILTKKKNENSCIG